jgi:hypothetical protein
VSANFVIHESIQAKQFDADLETFRGSSMQTTYPATYPFLIPRRRSLQEFHPIHKLAHTHVELKLIR